MFATKSKSAGRPKHKSRVQLGFNIAPFYQKSPAEAGLMMHLDAVVVLVVRISNVERSQIVLERPGQLDEKPSAAFAAD